ncbi:MAG: hypothetical protein HY773_00970 [Candidatus Terrybacteria bacterium]|nr:hypothetical protein [Candidatus Terrybacteria bacterium]
MDKETKNEFENLARMIQIGFDETAKKVDVDKRFEQVDKRFDKIEAELTDIKGEIYQMRAEIKQIWNKLEEIEQKLERISQTSKEDVDAIASDVLDLKQRIGFLENQIKEIQKA